MCLQSNHIHLLHICSDFPDQGFTRPKVLILLPFREAAYRTVTTLISLLLAEGEVVMMHSWVTHWLPSTPRCTVPVCLFCLVCVQGQVTHRRRFVQDYTDQQEYLVPKKPKPGATTHRWVAVRGSTPEGTACCVMPCSYFRVVVPCTLQSLTWFQYWNSKVSHAIHHRNSCETPPFQCCNRMSNCSVQCAGGTRNSEAACIKSSAGVRLGELNCNLIRLYSILSPID